MTDRERIRRTERAVVAAIVDDAIAAGMTVTVWDGDAYPLASSTDRAAVLAALFSVDEESLVLRDRSSGVRVGTVWLVHGNDGWDVIHDHSASLTDLLARESRIADRLSAAEV